MSRRIRTLVVDDSEFFAEMTAETLTAEHEIDATHETSASDALETLEEAEVDCIVSDYEMPGMDGIEFLRTVRERYDALPFIILTGRGDEMVASEAIESGVADYLLKVEVVEDDQYRRLANRIESVVSQQRTQEKYERLVENSPDAIAHVAADGTLLSANPAMADRLDTGREHLAGADITDVFPADVGARRLGVGRQVVETGDPERTEDSYDGRYFHNIFVPLATRRTRDSFQLISREVTERKERERELERQNERLERFASVVSHDLRNPLNVAQTSVELLREDCADEDVERIERSLDRMGDIIDDVLTLAREGETVGELRPVDLATTAREAWEYVETDGVTLETGPDRRIEADDGRLRDMLQNLFANAVQHGGDVTSVTVGGTDEGFYVADDGDGVPADHADEVFEPGFTTDRTGTGLGLRIVRDVADAHGWQISLDGSRGGGARFDVVVEES